MARNSWSRWTIMAAMLGVLAVFTAVWSSCGKAGPLSIEIVSPPDGASLNGIITLRIQTSDNTDTADYAVDQGAFQSLSPISGAGLYEALIDTTALSGGIHFVDARATDVNGNTAQHSIRVDVDNPPIVSIVQPAAGAVLKGQVALRIKAVDDIGIATVEYALGRDSFKRLAPGGDPGFYEVVFDTSGLAGGTYTITARATDEAGQTASSQVVNIVDNPPTVSIANPVEGVWQGGTVLLEVRAADDSWVSAVEFSIDSGTFEVMGLHSSTGSYEAFIDTTAMTAGSHTVRVRVRDTRGQTAEARVELKVDNSAPIVALVRSFSGVTTQGEVTLQITARDDLELSAVEYAVDGGQLASLSLNRRSGYYETVIDTRTLSGGTHSVLVSATDGAGNTAQTVFAMAVDNPPTMSIANLSEGMVLPVSLTLQIKAEDDLELAAVEYSVDEGDAHPLALNSATGYHETTIDAATLGEGARVLAIRATDGMGQTTEVRIGITVDNRPPELTLLHPKDGAGVSGVVTFVVRASDDLGLAAVEYQLNGGAFRPMSLNGEADLYEVPIDTTTLDGGPQFITVRAIDRAGQTAQAQGRILVDNPPVLHIISPTGGSTLEGIVTLQVSASDDTGLSTVVLVLDGPIVAPASLNGEEAKRVSVFDAKSLDGAGRVFPLSRDSGTGLHEAIIDTTRLEGGKHTFTIRAVDAAGNTTEVSLAFAVDNPPSLNIIHPAEDMVVQGVLTVQVRAADDLGPLAVEFSLDEGAFSTMGLNIGTKIFEAAIDTMDLSGGAHLLEFRVKDDGGHTESAQISVKVDNPPSVNIVRPADGATIDGKVRVDIEAGDDISLSGVEFTVGGKDLGSLFKVAGRTGLYRASIDTTDVRNGAHVITATASDDAGQTAETQITVVVENVKQAAKRSRSRSSSAPPPPPPPGPSVTILTPVEGLVVAASVTPSVTLQVQVAGGVTDVAHTIDGIERGPLSTTTEAGIFETTIDVTGLAGGNHAITVCGKDSNGVTIAEAQFDLFVDNLGPEALFIGLAANATVFSGSETLIQVDVTDSVSGIASAEWQTVVAEPAPVFFFDALEVFPPAGPVGAPLHPNPQIDTTVVPVASLPADSSVLFVAPGAIVTEINDDGQEWVIDVGGETFFIYTSASTEIRDLPVVGSVVKIVAERTLTPGPIVAELIRRRTTPVAEMEVLFLLTGVVTRLDNNALTVAGVDFAIIETPEPTDFELDIEVGVTVATVEFVISAAGAAPPPAEPPSDPASSFVVLEIIPPVGPLVVPPTEHPNPQVNTTPLPAPADVLPAGTIAGFVLVGGEVIAIDANRQEWEIEAGGETFFVYTSAETEIRRNPAEAAIQVGNAVKIVAVRSLDDGPIVAELIRFLSDVAGGAVEVEIGFLFQGVVSRADSTTDAEVMDGDIWTVGGVDFVLVNDPANDLVTAIEFIDEVTGAPIPVVLNVTEAIMEFDVLAGGAPPPIPTNLADPTPDDAAWQPMTLNETLGLWEALWQVPSVADATPFWILIRGTDNPGNMAVFFSSVVVTPDDAAPTVTITSPTDGQQVAGTITVSADVSDNVMVTEVRFLVDNALIGTATNTPFSVQWDTTSVTDGLHKLTAEASDPTGNVRESADVEVTVSNGGVVLNTTDDPPSVNIVAPVDGATMQDSVTLQVDATDDLGLATVEFSVDSGAFEPLSLNAQTGFHEAIVDTTGLADGTHTITVRATDSIGQIVEMQISVTVGTAALVVGVEAPASVAPGGSFTAMVSVGQVTNFDAGQFDISFDPNILTIDNISPGADITNGDIGGTPIPVDLTNEISAGTIRVVMNVPGLSGVTGSGFLAEIAFSVIGADGTSSEITLAGVVLSNNLAEEIPSTTQGATLNVVAP